MPKIVKIIIPIIFWSIFAVVVWNVNYPENITSANLFQLFYFFIPLLLALTFTFNLFLNFLFSLAITLGMVLLLVLKSLDSLNFISTALAITAIVLLLSYFKKSGKRDSLTPIKSGLTSRFKIPKLRSLQRRKHV